MIISEEDLKCRILRGQVKILDDVLNELRTRYESSVLCGHSMSATHLMQMITTYSKYHATIKKEIKETKTRI